QPGTVHFTAERRAQITELATQLQAPARDYRWVQGSVVIRCKVEVVRCCKLHPAAAGNAEGGRQKTGLPFVGNGKRQYWRTQNGYVLEVKNAAVSDTLVLVKIQIYPARANIPIGLGARASCVCGIVQPHLRAAQKLGLACRTAAARSGY